MAEAKRDFEQVYSYNSRGCECGCKAAVDIVKDLRKQGRLTGEADYLVNHLPGLLAAIDDLEAEKAAVYRERDQIVAVLSKLWPSHLAKHLGEWEDDWRNIVCIHSPVGQVSWHIHDSEMSLFNHLEITLSDWDGHTTPEKYERLSEWPGL